MDQKPDVIRDQMEDTRASLGKKIEALENTVVGTVKEVADTATETVSEVTEAVTGTVETVTEAVEGTASAIKSALDIPGHVRRHPWISLGGAFVAGLLAERLLHPSRPSRRRELHREGRSENGHHRAPKQPEASGDGWLHSLGEGVEEMIQEVKKLALGTTLSFARDLLTQSVSEGMKPHLAGLVDRLTSHLGGQPIEGSVVSSSDDEDQEDEDDDADSSQAPRSGHRGGNDKRRGKKRETRK